MGYNTATSAYAYLQVLEEGVAGAKSLDQDKIAAWLHANELHTVLGNFRYGADARCLAAKFAAPDAGARLRGRQPGERMRRGPAIRHASSYFSAAS